MPQFLIPPGRKAGDRVTLSPEESRHAARVLRVEPGTAVRLTDGCGGLFAGHVETVTSRGVTVRIDAALSVPSPRGRVVLAQGLLKGEKMEFVIQKAAELGAAEVLPFNSSRTVAAWKSDARKLDRWRKIAEAASKQSGRSKHLAIREPADFSKILSEEADVRIAFWEESKSSAKDALRGRDFRDAVALVGPEGGLSREEARAASAAGFAVLSMGPLILRAETAAVTALSVIQYELGNL
jgi:16S rRNA (uracil1498-N3)-methyltransferase